MCLCLVCRVEGEWEWASEWVGKDGELPVAELLCVSQTITRVQLTLSCCLPTIGNSLTSGYEDTRMPPPKDLVIANRMHFTYDTPAGGFLTLSTFST